jgi:hypothetical protein
MPKLRRKKINSYPLYLTKQDIKNIISCNVPKTVFSQILSVISDNPNFMIWRIDNLKNINLLTYLITYRNSLLDYSSYNMNHTQRYSIHEIYKTTLTYVYYNNAFSHGIMEMSRIFRYNQFKNTNKLNALSTNYKWVFHISDLFKSESNVNFDIWMYNVRKRLSIEYKNIFTSDENIRNTIRLILHDSTSNQIGRELVQCIINPSHKVDSNTATIISKLICKYMVVKTEIYYIIMMFKQWMDLWRRVKSKWFIEVNHKIYGSKVKSIVELPKSPYIAVNVLNEQIIIMDSNGIVKIILTYPSVQVKDILKSKHKLGMLMAYIVDIDIKGNAIAIMD